MIKTIETDAYRFFNEDCISGARTRIADRSVDLIITDPPYGIEGDRLHRHYNRNEKFVLDGYIEIPSEEYAEFSLKWIAEAERVLRPGGSIYIVSGWSNLFHILSALKKTKLVEINHIIWKYNFGVYTSRKYISSHYHILFYVKSGAPHIFNTNIRFGADEKDEKGGSLNYKDREDVWRINREYKPGRAKNKNELPLELLTKIILYSSREGDVICDFFLGGFSTAKAAIGLKRKVAGFEISPKAFEHGIRIVDEITPGFLLSCVPATLFKDNRTNYRKRWTPEEKRSLAERFQALKKEKMAKKSIIKQMTGEFQRGRFAIERILKLMKIY
jgi:site-specific DNA-methyltransferase (adenine-specific)